MNNDLLNYIQFLSQHDTKSLQGKALKTTSEAGDLAEKTLAYTSAPGARHRFTTKRAVLNEAVDTILCALSVAYDLGYTHEEIESMMVEKSAKWRSLQVSEQGLEDPDHIPFEIHVTVANVDVDHFKRICGEVGVKPILLDLQDREGVTLLKDCQTSSVFFGNNTDALHECERIVNALRYYGIEVVREKIETVPWHPAAPSRNGVVKQMPENCYFEVHFGIVMPEDDLGKIVLKNIAKRHNAHLSQNVFKRNRDGESIVMMTYRAYKLLREDFEYIVQQEILPDLKAEFEVEKVITEFSIYDTKVKHDAAWIG